ncbi:amidase [uncultured Roseobacter sp.]|uniref:amidase n=1 Tax=uncultured Roseobacter sp. TaxID=114847 RepID=UPI00260FF4FC|nr:amidase [uncultured Roseobacter sp.]
MTKDVIFTSALDLSAQLATGRLSATDLMRATLDRIDQVNGQVNAIVSLRERDALMSDAQLADQSPRRGWLHGIPIAIKELAHARGLSATRCSPLYKNEIAVGDDLFVARIRAAGAIIIGKTNAPAFGLGSHTSNPVFGATRNPYNTNRSSGGSSGGAAAALATGMLSVADGSDMMGSLRNPAGWNNVYGMRPTWGRVPDPADADVFFNTFATDGPMARTPGDLAALLDTMSGSDPRVPGARIADPTLPGIDCLGGNPRVGWLGNWDGALPMAPGVLETCEAALGEMQQMGWTVENLSAPFSADRIWDSWTRLRAWTVAMRYQNDYEDAARRQQLNPQMLFEIESGLGQTGRDIHAASLARSDWFRSAIQLFDHFDVLALPTAQVWPFDVDLDWPRAIGGTQMDTYHRWMQVVVPASLIGLPAISVPAGFGADGLPMGLQLIGRPDSDAHLLQIAQSWHLETDWPGRRPAMV